MASGPASRCNQAYRTIASIQPNKKNTARKVSPKNADSEAVFARSKLGCASSGGFAAVRCGVATWNLRGQRMDLTIDQLVHVAMARDIGAVCLTETHGGTEREAFLDHAGDTWQVLCSAVSEESRRGTGFLISPKFEVLSFEQFSPRVSLVRLSYTRDAFWSRQYGITDSMRRCVIGLISVYMPTETRSTPVDMEVVYCNLEIAVDSFRRDQGYDPIIAGDFNVNIGADLVDMDEGQTYGALKRTAKGRIHPLKTTGRWSAKRVASKNCAYLFDFNRANGYVVANTFFGIDGKEIECTWFHPRTKLGHVKDLVLVPTRCLATIYRVNVDHASAAGNNDHSLVHLELKARSYKPARIAGRDALVKYCNPIMQRHSQNVRRSSGGAHQHTSRTDGDQSGARGMARRVRALHLDVLPHVEEAFRADLSEKLQDADGEGWEVTKPIIQQCLIRAFPKRRRATPPPSSWKECSKSLHRLYDVVNGRRQACILSPASIVAKAELLRASSAVKAEVRRAKTRFKWIWCRIALTGNRWEREKAVGVLQGKVGTVREKEPEVTPAEFATHFGKLFSKQSEKRTLGLVNIRHLPPKVAPARELSGPPTPVEVSAVIKKLNSMSAAGSDGLVAKVFKIGGEPLNSRLLRDFQDIWPAAGYENGNPVEAARVCKSWQDAEVVTLFKKGNPKDPGNYRGIFLLEVAGKILTSVVAERLSKLAEGWLSDSQCGFRKKRGTLHQILQVRKLQSEVERASVETAACFVDFKKAFDSPPREAIYEVLEYIGCPADLLAVVMGLHHDPEGKVRNSDVLFKVLRGVRQGCTLGPILFLLLLEFCLRAARLTSGVDMVCRNKAGFACPADILNLEFRIQNGAFADDIYLVGPIEQVQEDLNRLDEVCASIGLDISCGKTEWLWLWQRETTREECRGSVDCCRRLVLGGSTIKHVRVFSYLGSLISEEGGVSAEVDRRCTSARNSLHQLSHVWTSAIPRLKKLSAFTSQVLPGLLYGCETWNMKRVDYDKIEVFLNECRLKILNRPRYLDGVVYPNAELHRCVVLPSAVELIVPRRLGFLLNVIAHGHCEGARRMIFAEVKSPVQVRSGTDKDNLVRCMRAELDFIVDEATKTCVSLSRRADAILRSCLESKDRGKALFEVLTSKVETVNSRTTKSLLRELLGASRSAIGKRKDKEGDVGAAPGRVPSLRPKPLASFQCTEPSCQMAYVEKKALHRHIRLCHSGKGREEVLLIPHLTSAATEDKPFKCSLCEKSYKTMGWLTRHLGQAHGESGVPISECTDPLSTQNQIQGTTSLVSKAKTSRGLSCEICGKGAGPGRSWGTKTLANHMAREHKVNARTGGVSRSRMGKSCPVPPP